MVDDLDELTGGLRRMWSTASLTSKLGAKAAGRMLFKRKVDPDEALASTDAAVATAKKLVDRMGHLKGLVMKAGQIASYMPGTMPPAAQQILAQLQAQSTPMAFGKIAEVLHADGVVLDSIDERPFAAASIGQVHRATYRGRDVAVKVQYPGIEAAIRGDLKMVGVIARLSSVGSPLDGGALATELRDRLLEECDYEQEAANQRLFARLLAGVAGASVPEVVLATRRVLVSEMSLARPLGELADQPARDRAALQIFRACFELLFRRCIYNADPHPGNYLASPAGLAEPTPAVDRLAGRSPVRSCSLRSVAGDVTFLDFGCVRRFDPEMIATWKAMARGILDGDRAAMEHGFRALGFVGKERGFDWAYQFEAMRTLYRPYIEPSFRYTPEFVANSFGVLMFDNPNKFRIAMPPEWLFLNRLQWGLNAVLAQLSATGPWRETIEELLASPLEPA